VNSSISFVIQHTAQIDGGNSGGPLLVQNSRSNVGFDVIGINTWKTNHREGTNFAVPAAHITQFLDSIGYIQTAIKNEAKIAERMKAFAAITKSKTTSYKDILPFVSMDYMLSVPAISFMAMMSSASDSARIHAREQFHEIEPFGAFRIIIADAIWRTRSNALTFENTAAAQTPAVINVNFSENGKPVQSEWKYDEGYFSLINFGGLRIKQFRTKASKNYNPDAGAHATVAFPNNDFQTTIYEIGLSRFYNRYIGQGGAFGFNMIDIPAQNEHSEPEKVTNVCIIFNALILQRPIEISKFHIIPYGRVPLAMNLGNALYASVGADFGAKFGMAFKNGNFVYLGLEYRMRFAKYLASEYRGILPERLNSFGITLGYEY
jgi:serine protease Do